MWIWNDEIVYVQTWASGISKQKRETVSLVPEWLQDRIAAHDGGSMEAAYQIAKKQARGEAVQITREHITSELAGEVEAKGISSQAVRALGSHICATKSMHGRRCAKGF
jgi:polyribonucleotide nucleotidyltransferase